MQKNPIERNMTYVEILDFRAQEHEHEMERVRIQEEAETKRAKYKLRETRQDFWEVVAFGAAVVAVIAIIAVAIYFGTKDTPPPSNLSPEERREYVCTQSNGAWVPKDLLADSTQGLCVYPKDSK